MTHHKIKNRLKRHVKKHCEEKGPEKVSENKNEACYDCAEKNEKQDFQRFIMLQFKI